MHVVSLKINLQFFQIGIVSVELYCACLSLIGKHVFKVGTDCSRVLIQGIVYRKNNSIVFKPGW